MIEIIYSFGACKKQQQQQQKTKKKKKTSSSMYFHEFWKIFQNSTTMEHQPSSGKFNLNT